MVKGSDSNNLEKTLLLVLSFISVGLLVAIIYVWYSALSSTNKTGTKPGDFIKPEQPQTQNVQESSPSSEVPAPSAGSLSVTSPKDQDVVSAKTVSVAGTTLAKGSVTVTGGRDDVIATVSADGSFSEEITLNEGQNDLVVTSFDDLGNQVTQTIRVVYIPQ